MRHIVLVWLLIASALAQPSFLMPDEAFKPAAQMSGESKVKVDIKLGEDIYLYKEQLKLSVSEPLKIAKIIGNEAVDHDGEMVYDEDYTAMLFLEKTTPSEGTQEFTFTLSYQGCSSKGICYEPETRTFTLKTDLSKVPLNEAAAVNVISEETIEPEEMVSESAQIALTLSEGSLFWIILSFFGFGLLLSLTPCVFPMIPILSSVIVSQGDSMTTRRAFYLSLVYVLAMSVAYTLAGLLAGLFGSNLQAAFQDPWIISTFSLIFVLLAFSMFGLYDLQMPSFIQTRLTNAGTNQKGALGVAIMGFLSALIVGPCVAAPLAGALIYIGQSGDAVLGALALFAMSIGMGVPLLIIGTTAGKFMPKPGPWMEAVKSVFGFLLIAMAIWMLSRILPDNISMILWAFLLIFASVNMGAFERINQECITCARANKKALAIVIFIYGTSLLVGGLSGATNVLKPFEKFTGNATVVQKDHALKFRKVHSVDEMKRALNDAHGQKVMIDFSAAWCTSCKELDAITFKDPALIEALKGFVLIKADLSNNSAEEKALAKVYGVFGPPVLLFANKEGVIDESLRIVGYIPPEKLLKQLEKVK